MMALNNKIMNIMPKDFSTESAFTFGFFKTRRIITEVEKDK